MTGARVRVCIVNYRSGERAVAAARSAQDAGAEVVVFDNDPGDGTADLLGEALPGVEVRTKGRNVGFAAGCNRAAAGAKCEYLLFLNPDACLEEGSLDTLVARLDESSTTGIVGPALLFPDGRPQPSIRLDPSAAAILHQYTILRHFRIFRGAYRRYRSPAPPEGGFASVKVLMGSALLVRSSLFRKLFGFDERYFMYYEEADLCRRVREAGYAVEWVSAATVTHEGGASASKAGAGLSALRMVSAQRYVARFSSRSGHILFRAAFLLGFPLGAMFDLLRDTLYALGYVSWPPKHEKIGRKLREALSAARLLTADLFKVAAG